MADPRVEVTVKIKLFPMTWLLEINGRVTSHGNGPMDSVQVGKAVFVK